MRADARRNRERLLAAATELLGRHGPGVALDDVARHAGVGAGTVHRHFPTKEALLAAVVVDRVHAMAELGRRLAGADEPAAALGELLGRLVHAGLDDAPLKAVLVGAGFDLRAAAPDATAALRDAVATLLTRAQAAGSVRPDLDVDDVMALLAGIFTAVRDADVHADRERIDRRVAVLVDGLRA